MPQNLPRAAELLRTAADTGSPEAQYALATLYKEGNGVPKDPTAAAKLLGAAARSGNLEAQVEYAIALFNGSGTPKDESTAAALFRKAALKGNAVAQNRLARILATGRGLPADPIAATKWHTIAKAGGASDIWLENYMQGIKEQDRAAGVNAATLWLTHAQPPS
jgi:TPR repeat protein